MKTESLLSHELLWEDDGHVSEIGLTAMADGEEACVGAEVVEHVNICEACAQRLGEAVLLSLQAGQWLEQRIPERVQWPIPGWAIGLAIALAGAGSLPVLAGVFENFTSAAHSLPRLLALFARGAVAFLGQESAPTIPVAALTMTSALLLISCGILVARFIPRDAPVQGGA